MKTFKRALFFAVGSAEGLKTLSAAHSQKQQPFVQQQQPSFANAMPQQMQQMPMQIPPSMGQQQQTFQQNLMPVQQMPVQQFTPSVAQPMPQQASLMRTISQQDPQGAPGSYAQPVTIQGGASGEVNELCSSVRQEVCAKAPWMNGKFITYMNGCFASQLGFQPQALVGTGHAHYSEGPCPPGAMDGSDSCSLDSPVCVKDMFVHVDPMRPKSVTFQNECWAQTYFGNTWNQIKALANGWSAGRCSEICKDQCEWFQPVCGVGQSGTQVTYPNACAAAQLSSETPGRYDTNGFCNGQGAAPMVPHAIDGNAWQDTHAAPSGFKWETRPFLVPQPKKLPPPPAAPQAISRIVQFSVQQCIEIRLVCIRTRDGDFRTYMNRCLAQEDGYAVSVDDAPNNFQNDIAHLKSSNTEEIGECRENAHQRYIRKSEHGSPEAGCERLAPVCSVDGLITFMNKCQAHKMGYTDVSKLVNGACYNAAGIDDREKFDPVCDTTTKVTWLNKAYMDQWNLRKGKTNAAHLMEACPRWDQEYRSKMLTHAVLEDVCKFEQYLDPVCLSNNDESPITFLNRCMAHLSGYHSGHIPGVCILDPSGNGNAGLSLIQRGATPRLNPLEQGLVGYPYWRRFEEFYNPNGPSEKYGKYSDHQALSLFQRYTKGLKERGGNFLEMLSDLRGAKKSYHSYFGSSMQPSSTSENGLTTSEPQPSSTPITPQSTSGHWSLTLPDSALWALRNCTQIEPICDVQENLITHVNWCMAQRAGVQSSVGTLYKACPAGGMTVQDTACSSGEHVRNQPCVAGARFNNRCAAWEAGETNIAKALADTDSCQHNYIGTNNQDVCPEPNSEDAVCNLASDEPTTHFSMCKLQEQTSSFWLPFILEGECSELAQLKIKISGIWPRCATVQEAFDKFNATFEAAITDALLQMRSQSVEWATINAFGWAFGASCASCAGSATGCMMQKIEKLGLLGDEIDVPEFQAPENLYNNFRSSYWTETTTPPPSPPTTVALATTDGGTSTSGFSFVQTESESESKTLPNARGVHAPDWRKMNNLREMVVRVGLRCHSSDDERCSQFTASVFADANKMREFQSSVNHYLDQALQVHNANVLEVTSKVVGGETDLAWTLTGDQTVSGMFARLDSGRAVIEDADGNFEAFVSCNPQSLCGGAGPAPGDGSPADANTDGTSTSSR